MLHNNFHYIFKETVLGLMEIHLALKMDSTTHELQMTLKFEENYCDILCFISPTVLTGQYFDVTLKIINAINAYVKSCGRFYIDDYMDIAYSLRMNYCLLDIMPEFFVKELEGTVQFYEDVFGVLLGAAQGKKTYEDCERFLTEMWGY